MRMVNYLFSTKIICVRMTLIYNGRFLDNNVFQQNFLDNNATSGSYYKTTFGVFFFPSKEKNTAFNV